jgi:hypothetical protein
MTKTDEPLNDIPRMLAREAHLRSALKFALEHNDAQTTSGAIIGALASVVEDDGDAEALQMAKDAITALVNRSPREREAAGAWHSLRDGYDPEQGAIAIVDLARQVARTAQMFRLSGTQVPTGSAAIEAFRTDLVARFGESVPSVAQLQEWFEKINEPLTSGGLAVTGIVARVMQHGRLMGAGSDLDKTRKRVDRVLSRLPNPGEISTKLPIPPSV